jgi:hypothetical protein
MEPARLYNGSFSDSIGKLITATHSKPLYGDETKFPALKQNAIAEVSELISEMRNTNDPANFKIVLAKAAELRQQMAFATESDEANLFGAERTSGTFMSTLLSTEKYQETNQKIKALILDCIALLPDKTKTRRKFLGDSRYTFKLLKENDLLFASPFAMLEKMKSGKHNEADESNFAMDHLIDYKQKTLPLIYSLEGKSISKADIIKDQNLYIFMGRIELKTNNEWRTLTRHYTVLKTNNKGEIDIPYFKLHGIVALLHTSYLDITLHNQPMASLFTQILNAPSDQLTTLMREFEYRLHHICYFQRGSATTSEIILEALRTVIHPQYVLKGDLEAFAEPFLTSYLKA